MRDSRDREVNCVTPRGADVGAQAEGDAFRWERSLEDIVYAV